MFNFRLPLIDYYNKPFFQSEIDIMLKSGEAIDATSGGLVIGKSHDEGGIKFLVKDEDGIYRLKGELESYEYLLNPAAVSYFGKTPMLLNNHANNLDIGFNEYQPHELITKIDTTHLNFKYLIFKYGFCILSRNATTSFLNALEYMNTAVSAIFYEDDTYKVINVHNEDYVININGVRFGVIPAKKS